MKVNEKVYLGDSVYAKLNQFDELVLTTENMTEINPSNIIILDQSVMSKLMQFLNSEVEE